MKASSGATKALIGTGVLVAALVSVWIYQSLLSHRTPLTENEITQQILVLAKASANAQRGQGAAVASEVRRALEKDNSFLRKEGLELTHSRYSNVIIKVSEKNGAQIGFENLTADQCGAVLMSYRELMDKRFNPHPPIFRAGFIRPSNFSIQSSWFAGVRVNKNKETSNLLVFTDDQWKALTGQDAILGRVATLNTIEKACQLDSPRINSQAATWSSSDKFDLIFLGL